MSLLRVDNLCVEFPEVYGEVRVVDNFSLHMQAGEVHGLVGESGSGKSLATLAALGLLDARTARVRCDNLNLNGKDLLRCPKSERRSWLAKYASIIVQDAQSSLNPCYSIGQQIDEVIHLHHGGSRKERRERAAELLNQVGLHNIQPVLDSYPHQFSPGLNQRAMIALALACEPALLVADEPTTGLDVTIQAQILDLLMRLNSDHGTGVLLITHDMSLLAERVKNITVMYGGQVVENGSARTVLQHPQHPYTRALLDSIPRQGRHDTRLFALRGNTPNMHHLPVGCYFGPRCPQAGRACVHAPMLEGDDSHKYRCHFPLNKPETERAP